MKIALRAVLLVALLASMGVQAQPRTIEEPPVRYGRFHVAYDIRPDLTSTATHETVLTVLNAKALEALKQTTIHYSTSVQKVEVLEAYTRKADGRRIEVPKENYQANIAQGRDSNSPAFSDFSSVAIVFPDLAVGDTLGWRYRVIQTEPIFPGHFDSGFTFMGDVAFDDVRISVEYPESLNIRYAGRGMQQTEEALPVQRKRVQWQWANPVARHADRRDYSVVNTDDEIGAAASTFADYRAIARAYGERALPKATPSERVRALAREVVGTQTDAREQARLLYEWVSTRITYGGNCIGVGTVVPRDVDKVLDNRMGDCKDHATLLQALLAAQGIESDQVLINAGNAYRLPAIPQVSSVNHVINYLPRWQLYVDATAEGMPFGVLPIQLRGKPALHVVNWREGAVTPVPPMARRQVSDSRWVLSADGSMSGAVTVKYEGDDAIGMRRWARKQPKESRPDMVRDILRGMGLKGEGRIEMDDAEALTDQFNLVLHLSRVERFVRMPGPGAFYIASLAGGTTVGQMVQPASAGVPTHDTACTNATALENYVIELPEGMEVMALPPDAKVATNLQRYEASYAREGRTIRAQRSFEDTTPLAVCSAAVHAEYGRMAEQVIDNLKAQVLYR